MRICLLHLLIAASVAATSARAAEEGAARKPRPPTEYNARVQLHEMPATVAPPKLPDVSEDPRRVESRGAARLFSDRPTPATLTPQAPPADAPLPGLRELIQDSVRRPDARSGSTGWGWLADDIATNRARRAEREARKVARDELDEEHEPAKDGIEREDPRPLYGGAQEEQREKEAQSAGSASDDAAPDFALSPMPRPNDESILGAALWGRDDPREAAASPMGRFLDRRPSDSLSALDRGFLSFEQRAEAIREREDREFSKRDAETRPLSDGNRLPKEENLWPVDRPMGEGARAGLEPLAGSLNQSPLWSTPAFTPMTIGPLDVSATPLPAASPGIGALQAAPATTPALDSMGGARERAAPRTLPW